MNPERVIAATQSGALVVNIFGELASSSDPKLPRPSTIVGTLVFYGGLGLVSALGDGPARFAAAGGIVLFLVTLVGNGVKGSGQGGLNLLHLLTSTTKLLTGGPQQ